jgi:hypothetical protein
VYKHNSMSMLPTGMLLYDAVDVWHGMTWIS